MNNIYKSIKESAVAFMAEDLPITKLFQETLFDANLKAKRESIALELTNAFFNNLAKTNKLLNGDDFSNEKEYELEKALFYSFCLYPLDDFFEKNYAFTIQKLLNDNDSNLQCPSSNLLLQENELLVGNMQYHFMRYDTYKKVLLEDAINRKNVASSIDNAEDIIANLNVVRLYYHLPLLEPNDINLAVSYLIWPNDADVNDDIRETKEYYLARSKEINKGNPKFELESIYTLAKNSQKEKEKEQVKNSKKEEPDEERLNGLFQKIKQKDQAYKEEILRLHKTIDDLENDLFAYESKTRELTNENNTLKTILQQKNAEIERYQNLLPNIYESLEGIINDSTLKK